MKIVHALDGKEKMRRAELNLVQHLQAQGYKEREADSMLKKLHKTGVLTCSVGKYSEAMLPNIIAADGGRAALLANVDAPRLKPGVSLWMVAMAARWRTALTLITGLVRRGM